MFFFFFWDILGNYWVLGVNVEAYEDREPDIYVRGLLKKDTNSRTLRLLQSYFSIIGSSPEGFRNFTNKINDYRRRPPFNFKNPLENFIEHGIVQVIDHLINIIVWNLKLVNELINNEMNNWEINKTVDQWVNEWMNKLHEE